MVLDIILLSAIVTGLTEAIKRAFGIPKNWIPLLAVALAIFIGGTASFFGLTTLTFIEGIVAGLLATGLYSSQKAIRGK